MAKIVILADHNERISKVVSACSVRNVDAVLHTESTETFNPTTTFILEDADIVILDHSEPSAHRTQLVESIREARGDARILVTGLPGRQEPGHTELVFEYLEYGAAGYVCIDAEDQLPEAIEEVARGGAWVDPAMTIELVQRTIALRDALAAIRPHTFSTGTPDVLTARQTEVLELLASGLSNREIADTLFISVGTVKNHVHRILDVLQATSRDQAAEYYQYLQAPTAAA